MTTYKTVAELLEDPQRWTQGEPARNKDGNWVYSHADTACQWCLLGAIDRVYGSSYEVDQALNRVRPFIGAIAITVWNDAPGRTHAEVLELVRKAGV